MCSQTMRKAALVTGGAVRLGRLFALHLAGRGLDIALAYHRSKEAAQKTRQEIMALGVDCQLFPVDLSDADQCQGLISRVRGELPGLDTLINSASGYSQAKIADTSSSVFDDQFALNLRAPLLLTRDFAEQVGEGCVINIIDNKTAFNQSAYAAYLLSKKALLEFTRMAAVELAPKVRVNGLSPGVSLPMASRSEAYLAWRHETIPLARSAQMAELVSALDLLLDNEFMTGQIITVDGGEGIAHVGRNAGDYSGQ